jgi:hypothetical protein
LVRRPTTNENVDVIHTPKIKSEDRQSSCGESSTVSIDISSSDRLSAIRIAGWMEGRADGTIGGGLHEIFE